MRYEIVGNHSIAGADPGGHVDIDDPVRARRLVRGGHLAPAGPATCAGTTASGDPCSKAAGDDGYCHLHSEDD